MTFDDKSLKVNEEILEWRAADLKKKGDKGTYNKETWLSLYAVKVRSNPTDTWASPARGSCVMWDFRGELARAASVLFVASADNV